MDLRTEQKIRLFLDKYGVWLFIAAWFTLIAFL